MTTKVSQPRLSELNPYSNLELELDRDSRRPHALKVAPTLFKSFNYAWAGLAYTFTTQRNFRIQVVVGILALGLSLLLHLPAVDCAIISLTTSAVLALELLNTALESLVDLTVGKTYHPLAKTAKDCAAGSVLVAAIASLLVAGSLLLPRLYERLISSF
jgi:diacylglycerol kinase (ATP)